MPGYTWVARVAGMGHLPLQAIGARLGGFAGRWTSPRAPDPAPAPSLIFGLITCLTGVLGVGLGVEISRRLRRSNPRADPLVCAAGLLGSAPFLFLSVACARGSIVATYVSSQQVSRGLFSVQGGGMVHWGRTEVSQRRGSEPALGWECPVLNVRSRPPNCVALGCAVSPSAKREYWWLLSQACCED